MNDQPNHDNRLHVNPATGEVLDAEAYRDLVMREMRLAKVLESKTPLTKILVAVNVVIWVFAFFWGDTLGIQTPRFNNTELVLFTGMKVNELVADGQWWRLISSQFVHLNFMHIAFNAYGLYVLGPIVERFYGWKRFLLLYLASGTVGALASYFFVPAFSGGASGAIYGLVGVLLVFGFKYRHQLPQRVSKALTTGMLPWVVFSLGIGFLDAIPMDNAAHLGGIFSGALLALVTNSRLNPAREEPGAGEKLVWVLCIVALGALGWTAVAWGQEALRCVSEGSAEYFQCYPNLARILF